MPGCNPLDNFYSDDKIEMDRGCSLQKYLICPTEDYADSVWYFNKREVKRGTRLYDLNITGKGIEDDIVECYVNGTQLLRTVVVGRGMVPVSSLSLDLVFSCTGAEPEWGMEAITTICIHLLHALCSIHPDLNETLCFFWVGIVGKGPGNATPPPPTLPG